MTSSGILAYILLIFLIVIIGGVIWLVFYLISKKSNSAKEILELKKRINDLEDKN